MNAPPAIRRQTEREFQAAVVKLARERIVYAELKDEKGKPTDAQCAWLDALDKAGAETYLWRPSMMDEIVAILTARARA